MILVACSLMGAAPAAEPTPLAVRDSQHIDYATHHVQGLAVTDDAYWISSVDKQAKSGYVYRFDRKTLRLARERQLSIGQQFHPGGMQLAGGRLWVPLAEYRPRSTSTILGLNPDTLETERSFTIDDHIGALAADGRGTLYAGNWDCRYIYILDDNGKQRQRIDNPTGVAYQDFEFHDGELWATGRLKQDGKTASVVDRIDTRTWKLVGRYALRGKTRTDNDDFSREGFSKRGATLYLLPEDGPNTTVYTFELPPD